MLSRNHDRCRVVPFGIQADGFRVRDGETIAKIRQRYGRRIVLAVGRMVYYKGFEYLIRAMKSDPRPFADRRRRAVAPRSSSIWRSASGVSERISFLGRVAQEEMVAYYHAADVFVLPSMARSEAFGMVQLEAMAAASR